MFGIGFSEIILLVIIAIIVLGPEKLPEAGQFIGKVIRSYRNFQNDFTLKMNENLKHIPDQEIEITKIKKEKTNSSMTSDDNKNDQTT